MDYLKRTGPPELVSDLAPPNDTKCVPSGQHWLFVGLSIQKYALAKDAG